MREQIGKYYKIALTLADIVYEYSRIQVKRVHSIDWKSYLHPSVYTSEGIERLASVGLDLFIGISIMLFPLGGWIIGIAYVLLRDALPFLQGQSLGKHFFGLRVVTKHNLKPITGQYKRSIIRGAIILIPGLNLWDIYVYFTSGQRLADEWTQTMVIKERYHIGTDTTGKEI
ncbi:MAG: hypothetical protein QM786_15420 [Breznakibacter sp.]